MAKANNSNVLKMLDNDTSKLEEYIRQIKSYEDQMRVVEANAKHEEELKKNRPVLELVLWTGIAGLHFHVDEDSKEGAALINSLLPGTELKLVRDAENIYDRWAVSIYAGDKMLGYITRYKNETVARLMDAGHEFHVYVEEQQEVNDEVPEGNRAYTENFLIPISIWMEK